MKKSKLSKKQVNDAILKGVELADDSQKLMLKLRHEKYLKNLKIKKSKNFFSYKLKENQQIIYFIVFSVCLMLFEYKFKIGLVGNSNYEFLNLLQFLIVSITLYFVISLLTYKLIKFFKIL